MNDDRQGKAAQMERIERRHTKMERLSRGCRCEQVDRIPNAPLLEKTVKACECRHGHAASQPTFYPRRHWIRFEWQQRPGKLWRYRHPLHLPAGRYDARRSLAD